MKQTQTNTEKRFLDMRGSQFSANYIELYKGRPYYCGMPIASLVKDQSGKSKYYYNIIIGGANMGTIALENEDYKHLDRLINPIEFTRINSDSNDNPRYVCHFLRFINEGDQLKCDTKGLGSISCEYNVALNKARKLGGRKFHNKQYGGGIVFQMYDGEQLEMSEKIHELSELNTDFLTEWTDKQFKQVEKAIYMHLCTYTYKFQPTHDKESRKDFRPFRYEEIETTLGLAYTSTSKYAALWVCNSGYLMANDTHYFNAFAINKNGQIVGIVQDENENEIFIEL